MNLHGPVMPIFSKMQAVCADDMLRSRSARERADRKKVHGGTSSRIKRPAWEPRFAQKYASRLSPASDLQSKPA
jgi:hypothetical protein